jgi:alkylhydroperoxidase family enzyme
MDRVRRIRVDETSGDTREIFDLYQRERGNVPNMFRTLAHRPDLLRTMIAHFREVMKETTVTVRIKELIAVAVSGINDCEY